MSWIEKEILIRCWMISNQMTPSKFKTPEFREGPLSFALSHNAARMKIETHNRLQALGTDTYSTCQYPSLASEPCASAFPHHDPERSSSCFATFEDCTC